MLNLLREKWCPVLQEWGISQDFRALGAASQVWGRATRPSSQAKRATPGIRDGHVAPDASSGWPRFTFET